MPRGFDPGQDLHRILRPGDLVWVAQVGGEPSVLVDAVLTQARRFPGIRLMFGYPLTDTPERAAATGIRCVGMGAFAGLARVHRLGMLDLVPAHYSRYSDSIRSGVLRPDVVLLQATPADENGRHSLGVTVDHLATAMEHARTIAAQINPNMPWTHGDTVFEHDRFDWIVEASSPIAEWKTRAPGEIDFAIAEHVARLVPDGATIQYGVGTGPDAIVAKLARKKDLGIHSGSLADSFVDLMEAGAVTNRRKEIDPGFSVATTLYGSRRLYDFVHRNPRLCMRSATYTHSGTAMAPLERFVSINSALEVDLTGQIGSEAVGGRQVGAIGGQVDFQRAALASPEGKGIIALGSRAGGKPRIVRKLTGPVTTPRGDAEYVVTEHGVAELAGRTLEERARAMIAIAHPEDRADLEKGLDELA